MDYEVNATPDECLSKTEAYLPRWPYGGHYSRNANQASMLVEEERGLLGKLLTAVLFVVSLGSKDVASNMHTATVTVVGRGDRAVVATAADKPEHRAELDRWVREELGGTPA